MKTFLRNPFERMLQGIAYWLAYKGETYKCEIIEADAVTEAIQILQSQLPSGYKVVREFPYGNISKSFGNKHADLAILNADKECEDFISNYSSAKEYVFKQEALYLMSQDDEAAKNRILYLLKEE